MGKRFIRSALIFGNFEIPKGQPFNVSLIDEGLIPRNIRSSYLSVLSIGNNRERDEFGRVSLILNLKVAIAQFIVCLVAKDLRDALQISRE